MAIGDNKASDSAPALDPVIHPINRFKICAVLSSYGAFAGAVRKEMKYSRLREETGLSEATLSKQLTVLQEAAYIEKFRDYGATRAKDTVWVMLTETGKRAFDGHLAFLKGLAG